MPSKEIIDYFIPRVDTYKKIMKDEMNILANSSLEIVDGFDFQDDELMTVLGKKTIKNEDELY